MIHNASFRRKVIYLSLIALLWIPLFFIGGPAGRSSGEILKNRPEESESATTDPGSSSAEQAPRQTDPNLDGGNLAQGGAGGILAQLRAEYNLAQANIGVIDPASEAMKLGMLGFDGVAGHVLWQKAQEYRKKKDWDNVSTVVNQLKRFQPNFIRVWEFQGHNLSYNISAEFDDYRYRYHWVKKGIEFLVEGTQYNRDEPKLLWNVGWFVAHKIGFADEVKQFRVLFGYDYDFHDFLEDQRNISMDEAITEPLSDPNKERRRVDNFLAGRLWFQEGVNAGRRGKPLRGKSPVVFYSNPAMTLISYATFLEKDGILNEVARRSWRNARDSWREFGEIEIPTSFGITLRLNDLPKTLEALNQAEEELEKLTPGLREKIRKQRIEALSAEEKKWVDAKWEDIPLDQAREANRVRISLMVTNWDVANQAPEPVRAKAKAWAAKAEDAGVHSERIRRYHTIVNYEYWKARCDAEMTDEALDARRFLFEARQKHENAELEEAKNLYEKSWLKWRDVFDKYTILEDDVTTEDIRESLREYKRLLDNMGEGELPKDFALRELVEKAVPELLQPQGMKFDPLTNQMVDESGNPVSPPVGANQQGIANSGMKNPKEKTAPQKENQAKDSHPEPPGPERRPKANPEPPTPKPKK